MSTIDDKKKQELLNEYKGGERTLGEMVVNYDCKSASLIKRIPERVLMQIVSGYIQTEDDGDMASVVKKMGVLAGGYNIPIDVLDDDGKVMYRIEGQIDTMNIISGNLEDEISDSRIHRMNLMSSNNMDTTEEVMGLPLPDDSTFVGWRTFFTRMKLVANDKTIVKAPEAQTETHQTGTSRRVVIGSGNKAPTTDTNTSQDDDIDEWFD